jgi:hypothetical protein
MPAHTLWHSPMPTRPWFSVSKSRWFNPIFALALWGVGLLLLWPHGQSPELVNDSVDYIQWSSRRGVGYPLFLALVGHGPGLVLAQTMLSLACWMYLGHQAGGKANMVLALVPAFSIDVGQYDLLVLTEGLYIPLFALLAGLAMRLIRQPDMAHLLAWSVLAFWFALIRNSNPFLVMAWGGMILVLGRKPAGLLALAWSLAVAVLAGTSLGGGSPRYAAEGLNHVMLYRIMPDPKALAHFEAKGLVMEKWMPDYAAKTKEIAVYNPDRKTQAHELLDDYPAYASWLAEKAGGVYMRWVLFRPRSYLEVFDGLRHGMDTQHLHAKDARFPRIAHAVEWRYRLLGTLPLWLWAVCLLIPLAEAVRHRGSLSAAAVGILVLSASAYAHAFLAFHGHPGDVARYLLPSTAAVRVTWLLSASYVVRAGRAWFRGKRVASAA